MLAVFKTGLIHTLVYMDINEAGHKLSDCGVWPKVIAVVVFVCVEE